MEKSRWIVICSYEQKKMGGVAIRVNSSDPFNTEAEAQQYADFMWDEPYVIHDVQVVKVPFGGE